MECTILKFEQLGFLCFETWCGQMRDFWKNRVSRVQSAILSMLSEWQGSRSNLWDALDKFNSCVNMNMNFYFACLFLGQSCSTLLFLSFFLRAPMCFLIACVNEHRVLQNGDIGYAVDLCAFVMKVVEIWCLLRKSFEFVFKHSEAQHLSSFTFFAYLCRQLKKWQHWQTIMGRS